jgi:uncharacterized protein (TIGR00730 family)
MPVGIPSGASKGAQSIPCATVDKLLGPSPTPVGVKADSWDFTGYFRNLTRDLNETMRLLRTLPPAVTFFGGARLLPGDPYYAVAAEIGRLLAPTGIPPRTGAGLGIMHAVPEGYLLGLAQLKDGILTKQRSVPVSDGFSVDASRRDHETQGFKIRLPEESKLSPAVKKWVEVVEFPFRKLALYENARGLVTFPGGYGTLDELFEVWTLAETGKHKDPMIAVGEQFWRPLLDAIHDVAVCKRSLISPEAWSLLQVSDDPKAIVRRLARTRGLSGFEEPPDALVGRLSLDLAQAEAVLDTLPPAVAVIGGRHLEDDDPSMGMLCEAARLLTRETVPLRLAGPLGAGTAVVAGAAAADANVAVQGFMFADDPMDAVPGLDVKLRVSHLITEKELVSRRTRGLIAGPGGLGTLSKVFTLLCEIQTGKVPRVPVVLMGSDFWQPIFDAIKKTMLDGTAYEVQGQSVSRNTISPHDLDLVTITDDPQVAAQAFGR